MRLTSNPLQEEAAEYQEEDEVIKIHYKKEEAKEDELQIHKNMLVSCSNTKP